jgi:hypothetical protein
VTPVDQKLNVIDIHEMIDLIETHFYGSWGSDNTLIVGGVAGTSIFKNAIHSCMKHYDFIRILVLDGCRDYIGLLRKPVVNYMYYLDVFYSVRIPSLSSIEHPFYKPALKQKEQVQLVLDETKLRGYNALIVNHAELIPRDYLNALRKTFAGRILFIVDPLDANGIYYNGIPTIVDSLTKQSPLIALARSLYNIDTRAVDRKVKGSFKEIKVSKRSVGKIDINQYITNDDLILESVRDKQLRSNFRRNQKFITMNDDVQLFCDQDGAPIIIGQNSMLSISTTSKPLMKVRIHSSTRQFYSNLSYVDNGYGLYVKPANIMSIPESLHHRYQSIIVMLGERPPSTRDWYSLMKIANTVSFAHY